MLALGAIVSELYTCIDFVHVVDLMVYYIWHDCPGKNIFRVQIEYFHSIMCIACIFELLYDNGRTEPVQQNQTFALARIEASYIMYMACVVTWQQLA